MEKNREILFGFPLVTLKKRTPFEIDGEEMGQAGSLFKYTI